MRKLPVFQILGILFCIIPYIATAQDILPVLPLSRSDSGKIMTNDSLAKYYLAQGDYKEAARHLDENAMIYWKHNYFDQAIEYFKKSVALNNKIQNFDGIAKINTNLALIFTDKQQYDSALKYFEKTLAVRKAQNQKIGVISALINESVVLNKLGRYDESIDKLLEALSLAREINDIKQMRSCYGMLAETYQKAGDVEKSLYYYNFFKTFNDYVTKTEISKTKQELEREAYLRKIAELEAENQKLLLQQKQKELSAKQQQIVKLTEEQRRLLDSLSKKEMVIKIFEQKAKINQLERLALQQKQHRKNLVISFSFILLVILITVIIWLRSLYRKQKKLNQQITEKNLIISQQKEELENIVELLQEKNHKITDSINYALLIQRAIFSRNTPLDQITKDYFEIYLAKDIVSGDFVYTAKTDNKIFIAVADCTGHGVPGAFLTLIGYNLLDMLIKREKLTEPPQIVHQLNERFYNVLNQAETSNYDSLEIALCVIDTEKNTLEFTGERNHLIITEGKGKSKLVKANKNIFIFLDRIDEKHYTKQTIEIKPGQWFYMYTDGIIHQFNADYKKFSRKQLVEILEQIHDLNGEQKKQYLLDYLKSWMEGTEQLDDITILGFQIL